MKRINVTKTFLPPLEEYQEYLVGIWQRDYLTNQGPLLLEFQEKMKQYLGVEYFHFVSNGTVALQLALRSLDITEGEVITTPFTYVATVSAVLWERCSPVFVDIEPETFCIDAEKIEAAITPRTKAIMPVHVFGYPCNVDRITAIAQKHHLKVIYDGAHAFGATYQHKSLLSYGDISVASFHATKLFHTIEGGAVITNSKEVSEKIELLKRFGHNGDDHLISGINAKASEFQAAMGLCNLKYLDMLISERRRLTELYNSLLGEVVLKPRVVEGATSNYIYYPVVFKTERMLLKAVTALNKQEIYPRRYFYPSLNNLPYLLGNRQACPVSEKTATLILCLPLDAQLTDADITRICHIVNDSNEG
jgi:dTDP-4-amino-4,6-dideoxygalactose transaminase